MKKFIIITSINKHGKIIVVEDDIVTSVSFLTYMNAMLEKYKNYKQIYSIGGYNLPKKLMKIPKSYNYDVYLNPRGNAWGLGNLGREMERLRLSS